MRTVARALAWEFFNCHWMVVLFMLVVANCLPVLIILALRGYKIDLDAPEISMLPQAMIPFTAFLVGFAVALAQGSINRLYLKPLSNLQLTHTFFFPGLAITALLLGSSIGAWNAAFGLRWPILGPVCFGVTLWAAIYPNLRLPIRSPLRIAESIVVVLILSAWCIGFGQNANKSSSIMWSGFQAFDYAIMTIVIAASFVVCVYRISNDRCGKAGSLIVNQIRAISVAWDRRRSISNKSFAGPMFAQLWIEWRTFALPWVMGIFTLLAVVFLVYALSLFFGNAPVDITGSLLALFQLQVVFAGLWGFLAPHLRMGANEVSEQSELAKENQLGVNQGMSSFRATLPISDKQLASSILQSILIATTLSISLFGIAWLIQSYLPAFRESHDQLFTKIPSALLPWYLVACCLSAWSAMSVIYCVSLLNARSAWRQVGTFVVLIGLIFSVGWAPLLTGSIITLSLTIALAVATWKNRSSYRSLVLSLVLASLLAACVISLRQSAMIPSAALIGLIGLIVGAILPIHLIPLAVASYRRR